MRWLQIFLMRYKMLLHRGRAGEQLQDELQFHLDQQIAENVAAGTSPIEARRAALRSFGNPTILRDQVRNTWSWQWLELLLRDLRFGVRALARNPGFSILAILVMGLGIGANVALFTVVRSVLLKPLPFKDQDRLVRLYEADAHGTFQDNVLAGGTFAAWQSQCTASSRWPSREGLTITSQVQAANCRNWCTGRWHRGASFRCLVSKRPWEESSFRATIAGRPMPLSSSPGVCGSGVTEATPPSLVKQSCLMPDLTQSLEFCPSGSTTLTAGSSCGRPLITNDPRQSWPCTRPTTLTRSAGSSPGSQSGKRLQS